MNRKIKFRGKRVNGGEWVDSMTISNGTIKRKMYNVFFEVQPDKCVGVIPETVGQFTGKIDKNGKEIYEKDIVRVYAKEGSFDIVVKWNNDSMAFMACYVDGNQSPFSWFTYYMTYELEVIGNIFDNKELLKGEKQ